MIAFMLAAALAVPPTAPPDVPPLRNSGAAATIVAKYAEALVVYRTPPVLSYEYSVDQTGARDLQQTHRVFRSGSSQRDEILSVDGKKLDPPTVHIFQGRSNRYAAERLAPRPGAYTFKYVGAVRDGHHKDAVFDTVPLTPGGASVVRQVTIDGITFLPNAIRFTTAVRGGSGAITFGRVQKYWMVLTASAKATYAKLAAEEHITFGSYRFPAALPPSTFEKPRPLPSFRPTPY